MSVPSREYARLSALGVEFSLAIALFGWLGWKADQSWKLFGDFPGGLLIGVFLGLALGIYRLHGQLVGFSKATSRTADQEEDQESSTTE